LERGRGPGRRKKESGGEDDAEIHSTRPQKTTSRSKKKKEKGKRERGVRKRGVALTPFCHNDS